MCRALKDKQTNKQKLCIRAVWAFKVVLQAFFFVLFLQKYSLSSHCCLIVAHKHTQTHKIHDNNQICIIFWKSVYMKKYLNVWGFFYSFVYDTSLEMCLSGDVLLWNLRDTWFLVIFVFFFFFSVVLFISSGLGSSVLETGCSCVLGLLHQIPRLKWDCLPLGSFGFLEGLKVFKKNTNLIKLSVTTQALDRLLESMSRYLSRQ